MKKQTYFLGQPVTYKDNHGFIFKFNSETTVGVVFTKPLDFCHTYEGLFDEPIALFVETKLLKVEPNLKDKVKQGLFELECLRNIHTFLRKVYAKQGHKINLQENIKTCELYKKKQEEIKEIIKTTKKTINSLPVPKITEPDCSYFVKITKSKKIADIKIRTLNNRKYLIVETVPLTYHHKNNDVQDFILGKYLIVIPFNVYQKNEIKVINISKHFIPGHYHHPCIDSTRNTCFGNIVSTQINTCIDVKDFKLMIFTIINFLEKPNYGIPYIYAEKFQFAQKYTKKPKDIFEYLSDSFWEDILWDTEKFKTDLERFEKKRGENLNIETTIYPI